MEGTMHNLATLKQANLGGGGGETEFEQAFSSLAYAYLRDKAPRLLDHMIGFQLIDRNDDNTKAVGVFGFNVQNQWLYAPVFFLNGDLKGHELLYLKANDSFVPMTEKWVNYVMSRKTHVLGEGSAKTLQELGGVYPDIRSLSIPPSIGGGKRASDNSWVREFLPVAAAFKLAKAASLYPGVKGTSLNRSEVVANPTAAALGKSAQNLDFNNIMPHSFELLKAAHDVAESYPRIKRAMQNFYGVDCFSRWGSELKHNVNLGNSNLLPKEAADRPYMPGNSLIPQERPAPPVDHEKQGKLRLYVYEHVTIKSKPELTEDEREKLMRDTVLIKDEREDGEVSKAYNTQVEAKLTNPSETALYRVLVKPGEFQQMLIAMNGVSNRGAVPMATVVRTEDSGNKAWLNTHPTNVFADQISEREEWDEWFDSLSDSDSLAEGGEYIAINERGSCSTPFRVQSDYGEGRYRVDFKINIDWNETRPVTMPRIDNNNFGQYGDDAAHTPSAYGAMLYVDKEGVKGKKIKAIAGELRVPSDFKFLKLSEPESGDNGFLMPCCSGDRSDTPPINLGKIDDIQLLFHEKTARLRVFNNGTDVWLNSRQMSKKAGLFELVRGFGLREKIAREILMQAELKDSVTYRVQYAPSYGSEKAANPNFSTLSGGPDAPLFDDFGEERSVEQYGPRNAVPTQFGGEQAYRVDQMSADQTDPSVYDPFQNYQAEDFQSSMQVAQQAGSSGQKEVFDTAMISGMLKAVRQDSLVERHLGSLMESLDSLGRLLFLFYWHQEEFEDRYGKADMPELEDSLRNAFESLGDITLFLKEKTIESPFEDGDIDLDEISEN